MSVVFFYLINVYKHTKDQIYDSAQQNYFQYNSNHKKMSPDHQIRKESEGSFDTED